MLKCPLLYQEHLSSIKVKEGDTVEVGALLGVVNERKSENSLNKNKKTKKITKKKSYSSTKKKRNKKKI